MQASRESIVETMFDLGSLTRADVIQHLPVSTGLPAAPTRVALRDNRVFIPLARSGCGVACKYCYIPAPAAKVVPLSRAHMSKLLDDLRNHLQGPEQSRPIMAIGCDTEVGISPELTANVLACLDFATRHDLPVQIATKFPLRPPLREALESWPTDSTAPMVFTTITTITLSKRIEPNAPSPIERAANFTAHLPAWQSYALVKPFLNTPPDDKERLLNLLAAHRPDGVVVGVRYRRRHTPADLGDPHPIAPDWISTLPSESARMFVRKLSDLGLRVFMNTQCASFWHDPSLDPTVVRNNYPHLCVRCGRCPEEGKVAR